MGRNRIRKGIKVLMFCVLNLKFPFRIQASQVVLVVKNLPLPMQETQETWVFLVFKVMALDKIIIETNVNEEKKAESKF